MNKTAVLIALGIVVLCLSMSSSAWADAAGDYATLFGQDEKDVAAKGAGATAEFASRLLNAAKSAGGQKDLQALLCEKAFEFGIKSPAGCESATEAMKLLIEAVPEKKLAARQNLLKAQQLRYARGGKKEEHEKLGLELVDLLAACGDDKAEARQPTEAVALYRQALTMATTWKSGRTGEIMDKIKQLSAALEAEKRVAGLKARLEKDPKDAAARTGLIMAYLGELDSPAEAVKLLTPDVDEALRTYVPLTARKVDDLAEAACLQLAEWLVSAAEKATPADKAAMFARAKPCCERYLQLHTAQDAGLLKGKILLEKLEKAAESNSDKFAMWKLIRKALADQKLKRWPIIGGGFAQTTFEEVPPGGALLIGFRYTTIGNGQYPGVVQPIFLTGAGEVYGKTYGVAERGATPQIVKAKPGYAVGAIFVRGGGGFDAFKPIFMRIEDKGLNTKDSYDGPHIGGQGGGEGTVGGDGNFIVGLHGKLGVNNKMETMSAVSLAAEAAPAGDSRGPSPKKHPRKAE